MAQKQKETSPFFGFGMGTLPKVQAEEGVFLLAVYRDGSLTASAHATERGAMAAAAELLEEEQDDEEQSTTPEDRFAEAQRIIADEGGVMEIIPSPIHGG